MRRACQRTITRHVLLLAGLALVAATPAYATSILPGQSGVPPTGYPDPGNPPLLFDSGPQLFSFGSGALQVNVQYEFYVARDPFSPHLYPCGANCLDFALDAELVGNASGGTTTLNSISIGGFGGAGASIDVGYIMDPSSALQPSMADRTPGPGSGVITFHYAGGIPAGLGTKTLVLRTDLTNWNGFAGIGFNATVSAPGHDPFPVSGTALVSTPEPSSILLLGSGALLALLRKKRT